MISSMRELEVLELNEWEISLQIQLKFVPNTIGLNGKRVSHRTCCALSPKSALTGADNSCVIAPRSLSVNNFRFTAPMPSNCPLRPILFGTNYNNSKCICSVVCTMCADQLFRYMLIVNHFYFWLSFSLWTRHPTTLCIPDLIWRVWWTSSKIFSPQEIWHYS